MNIPNSKDIVKISHIFKNAIITCGISTVGSLVLLAVGFFSGWTTPDFYIVFLSTFITSLSGVLTFGILYFRKNERKGIRIGIEENKKLAIELLQSYNEYIKIMFENGLQPLDFKTFKEQNGQD